MTKNLIKLQLKINICSEIKMGIKMSACKPRRNYCESYLYFLYCFYIFYLIRQEMNYKINLFTLIQSTLLVSFVTAWCLKTTISENEKINAVDYSPDGSMIALAINNKTVRVYDSLSLTLKFSFDTPNVPYALKFNGLNTLLVVGSKHNDLKILTLATGVVTTLNSGQTEVYGVDFSSDSSKLVTCGKDNELRVWNPTTWSTTPLNNWAGVGGTDYFSCEFTSLDNILISQNTGNVRTISSPYEIGNIGAFIFYGGPQAQSSFAVSNIYGSESYIVAESKNQKLFDSPNNTTEIYSPAPSKLSATAYARTLDYFMTGGNQKKVVLFNATNKANTIIQSIKVLGDVMSADFTNDGKYLIVGCADFSAYIFQQYCMSCESNSFYNSTTKQCELCSIIQGCGSCYNGSVCALCSQGYYITATKTCSACLSVLGGCGVCTNSTYCTSPLPGFYLTAGNLAATCNSAMPGCLICNGSAVCLQCHNEYYLSSSKCQSCTLVSFCLKCYNSTYCTQCEAGYYPNVLAGTPPTSPCARCATNCLDCQSPTICFECVVGFYTSGTTCTACTTNCLACNNTNFCIDCAANYFITALGTCSVCTPPCLSCVTAATTCLSCYPGYYFNGVSACLLCSTGCLTCTGTGTTACLSCVQGYYYTAATTTCTLCNATYPNCQSCNSTNCSTCLTSFFYDSTATAANQCKSCATTMHGCILCSNVSLCLFCAPGHYLSGLSGNNSCQPCAVGCGTCETLANCTSCVPGYYFNSVGFTCPKCTSTCVTCSSPSLCLSCVIGYYLVPSTGVCTSCNSSKLNCLACLNDTNTTVQCTQCGVGFYLSSGSCSRCNANCVTCNSSSACLSCQLGYYFNSTSSLCLTCSPTCAECSINGTCQSCHVGYYLSSPNCLPCSSIGCLTCKPDLTCMTCITGYYLLSPNNTCQLCSTPLSNCLTCTSGANCSQCSYGYALTLSGSNYICSTCSGLTGCFHCSSLSICLACQSGYFLNSTICSSCPEGCRNCNSSSYCLSCGSSYFSGNILGGTNVGQCLKCQNYLTGCDICQNTTDCITCMSGYYLDSSGTNAVCKLCEINVPSCSICNSSTICTSCKGGYHLASNSLSCVMCSTTFASCRLCDRLGTTCTDCQSGYYISLGNCLLCSGNLPGCQICNGSSTCLQCSSGYFLNSPNCQLCSSVIPGCIFCSSSSVCLQCEGGYYLNSSFKCAPCQVVGCEVCVESAPTSCVTCNSLYYKATATSCNLCRTSISGCLTCVNSTDCSKCDVGYYLSLATTPPQCLLCSSAISGCSICSSNALCLQCKSMYFLNSNSQCQICSVPMTGCTFCTNSTVCLSCGSGYFLNSSSLCQACTDLTGCLVCKNSTTCLFCNTGYYFNSFSCSSCSIITGCYSCISNSICTSCKGGYTLNANSGCDVAIVKADKEVTEIVLKTLYLNETTLIHYMYTKKMNYTKVDVNWFIEARLYLLSANNTQINLTIRKAEWSTENDYTLIFYTDNPVDYNSIVKKMPFVRLLTYSLDLSNTKTGIQISETALQQILPNFQHSGSLLIDYNLNDAQFYSSYAKSYAPSEFPFYVLGAVFVGLLFFKYSLKALVTVPRSVNIGNIMPHILCFKVGALLLFPTYFEYINYCSGFMYADFPWLNRYFGSMLSDERDEAPLAYKFFFTNMNLGSMYLLGLSVVILLIIITFIVGKSLSPRYDFKMFAFLQFLYNFFSFGLIFAGCASLQGAILNPMESLSVNGAFYILGILVYFTMLCECIYKVAQDKVYNFFKIRVMIKATLLSLSHLSPIYLLSSAVLIDLILVIIEFKISEYSKKYCKFWLFAHISCDLALILLVFLPIIELTMIMVSGILFLAIVSEAIIHYKETNEKKQTSKFQIGQKEEENIWDLNINQKQNAEKDDDVNDLHNVTRGTFANKNETADLMDSNINGNPNQMSNLHTKYKRNRGFKKAREENKQKLLNVEKSNFKTASDDAIQTSYKEQNLTFMIEDAKITQN